MKPAEVYILKQAEPFKSILLNLQVIIQSYFNDVDLKFKWKIPFFYLNKKPFCYLNVVTKRGFVDLGFWSSNSSCSKYEKFLISDGRKVVKSLRYRSLDDINEDLLILVLKESIQNRE